MTDQSSSSLRRHAKDVLCRARSAPIGSGDRQDLRQLAIGLRWLEKKASSDIQERALDAIYGGQHGDGRGRVTP